MGNFTPCLETLHNATILGINPPVHDFAFFDFWAKPLGLLYLLQGLRERHNRVFLVDCIQESRTKNLSLGRIRPRREERLKPEPYKNIPRRYYHFGLSEEAFLKRLQGIPVPDLICLTSGMTYWYPGVAWCIPRIRRIFPRTPILLGGIYPRLCPDHAATLGADMVQTLPCALQGSYPAADLYETLDYGICRTTLGCPMRCEYCASRILDPEFILRSHKEILEEIAFQCRSHALRDMAFYDDALLAAREGHFYPLCEKLRQCFPQMRFHTPNGLHVRQIDSTCAEILYAANFHTLRLSLESVDPEVQHSSSHKVARREYLEAVSALRRAGFARESMETYVLIGLPGQSLEGVLQTLDFIENAGGKAKTAQFSPIPGTSSFQQARKDVPEIAAEPLLQNNTVFAPYVGNYLSPEALQQIKHRANRPKESPHKELPEKA